MGALKYCEKHDLWYDYEDGCPECTKFAKAAGNALGNVIGIILGGCILAMKSIKRIINNKDKKVTHQGNSDLHDTYSFITFYDSTVQIGPESIIFHNSFIIKESLSQKVLCAVYLYDNKCNPLINFSAKAQYKTMESQISASLYVIPPYDPCEYSDFQLQIPHSEINLKKGSYSLKYLICIFINGVLSFRSDYYDFDYKSSICDSELTSSLNSKKIISVKTAEEANFEDNYTKHCLKEGKFVQFHRVNEMLDSNWELENIKTVAYFFNKKGAEGDFIFTGEMDNEIELDYFEMVGRIIDAFVISSNEAQAFPSSILKRILSLSENKCFLNCVMSFTSNDFTERLHKNEVFLADDFQELLKIAENRANSLLND